MSTKLNLALIGYGRMGRTVEEEAVKRGHEVVARVDSPEDWQTWTPQAVDIAIEFTQPDAAVKNYDRLLDAGVKVVTGTTGWYDQMPEVHDLVDRYDGAFLYASNFSIGVNMLFELNRRLAELMNDYPDYDVIVEERHHRHKMDAPSGTAISLAKQVVEGLERKDKIASSELRERAPEDDEVSVGYTRAGEIMGFHRVSYFSDIDRIAIEHEAFNRRGFALGAVIAAEWLYTKQGFYNFSEVFH